jgi:hypothetical protein
VRFAGVRGPRIGNIRDMRREHMERTTSSAGYLAIILTTALVVGLAVALLEMWWN